jgi:hypothetical protein
VDLSEAVEITVALVQAEPGAGDSAILRDLTNCGIDGTTAVKLVQFTPIAFTRFLFRSSGVKFAPNYVVLGQDGQPEAERPIAEEPSYREAWAHCENAIRRGVSEEYFVAIASRSGGYRAIQDLLARGLNLTGIITGPPMLMGGAPNDNPV